MCVKGSLSGLKIHSSLSFIIKGFPIIYCCRCVHYEVEYFFETGENTDQNIFFFICDSSTYLCVSVKMICGEKWKIKVKHPSVDAYKRNVSLMKTKKY